MRRILLAGVFALGIAPSADAVTFRWANDGDANSMDSYTRQETFLLTFTQNMMEPLVRRDRNLKIEPSLAVSWSQPAPDVWRFNLRPNVKFHDGTPFTADDVVFSFQRATGPGSNIASFLASVKEVRKVDDLTVEFVTRVPNPIFLEEITSWQIMSKVWAEKNNAVNAAELTRREENFATRNVNGTGPFRLISREPDRRTVLEPNPGWWDRAEHNLTRVEFNVISNDATRVAALLSGELDMIYTVPPQDMERIGRAPGLRLHQGAELRTIYLGMDQLRPELLKSDVKGKNPFQDRRVRQAFYQAIDMQAIHARVMRGQSRNTALLLGPGVNGFSPALDTRLPFDPDASRRLLTEAGYPQGFGVTLDCPNDRYISDEAICQAVTAMLARVGVRVTLVAQTRARFFAEVNAPGYNTSFYLLGWTPNTYDAHNVLYNLAGSRGDGRRGVFNNGGYSNPKLDEIIDRIAVETDQEKRNALIAEGLQIVKDDVAYIPLHQQTLVWAAKQTVDLAQLADNQFPLRYVRIRQ
jgi:peptide/nickel transport system substrate-binding protein